MAHGKSSHFKKDLHRAAQPHLFLQHLFYTSSPKYNQNLNDEQLPEIRKAATTSKAA
jgi:hypothetical protein